MNIGSDEYWAARRAELLRAKRRREMARVVDAAINAALAALAIASVIGIAYLAGNRETRERAAFNEGRYGVSRAEAWRLAEAGVGMTSEELGMRNEEWRTDSACASLRAGERDARPYRGEVAK